jgi:sigma-E factor negative regulatory protein RseA
MNNEQAELTSALLDAELDGGTQEKAISALLAANQAERERFGRYRMIGDVMRGETAALGNEVSRGVAEKLRDEPAILAPQRRPARWVRPVAGLAVAASVAAAAVMVAPQLLVSPTDDLHPTQLTIDLTRTMPPVSPVSLDAIASAQTAQLPRSVAEAPSTQPRWQAINDALAERLDRLVIEHHEFGGRSGINGPVPHLGFVSYDAR